MSRWTNLGEWGRFEYWLAPDGTAVYRRKVSSYNYSDNVTGAPMAEIDATGSRNMVSWEAFEQNREALAALEESNA